MRQLLSRYIPHFFAIACLILTCQVSFAQNEQNTIDKLIVEAQEAIADDKSSEALQAYLRAKSLLAINPSVIKKARVLNGIGEIFMKEKLYAKAIESFDEALQVKLPTTKETGQLQTVVQWNLAKASKYGKNYKQAVSLHEELLKAGKTDPYFKNAVMASLVDCHYALGEPEQALDVEVKILESLREKGASPQTATAYNNVGYALKFIGKNEEAIHYFDTAQQLESQYPVERQSSTEVATLVINRAITLQNIGDNETALAQLQDLLKAQTKRSLEKSPTNLPVINSQANIPVIKSTSTLPPHKLAEIYFLQARIYYDMEDFYNAEINCKKVLGLDRTQEGVASWVRDTQELYSAILQGNADFESALEAYKNYLHLRDSLLLEERIRQEQLLQQQVFLERSEKEIQLLLADQEKQKIESEKQQLALEKKTQELQNAKKDQELQLSRLREEELKSEKEKAGLLLERKQLEAANSLREIELLRKQEELQKAALAQKELEEKQQKQQLQMLESENKLLEQSNELIALREKETKQRVYYIVIIFLVIGLLIVVYLQIIKKKNRKLEQQSLQLSEQNNELVTKQEEIESQRDKLQEQHHDLDIAYTKIKDSVNYAKRIQSSILFPEEEIAKSFEDFFIYFKPRDQVSGDFYWFAEVDGYQLLAAVDCTGHGVPGAFMSLIANDLLNEIVKSKHITDPGKVLTELNIAVQKTLNQERSENQDGMDMALFVFNKKTRQAQIAGAKNPVLLVCDNEMKIIKGDKMPIGGNRLYNNQGDYKTHSYQLAEGTSIYLFSDGYPDQFGGPQNRKFMIKRFRELLFENHCSPMQQQKENLNHTFTTWTEGYKQMDDVLVIGARV